MGVDKGGWGHNEDDGSGGRDVEEKLVKKFAVIYRRSV